MSVLRLSLMVALAEARRKLVMYWGCDNPYNAGHREFMDLPLDKFCDRGTYDIVQLAFLDMFADARDNNYPHLHLHQHHCNTTFDGTDPDPNVGLLHCPDVARQIQYCQSKGVRVGLSLGGGTGSYYFISDDQARQVANTLWNMFFVPKDGSTPRPFDDTVLDGIGLDIEGGTGIGYIAFLDEFSKLSKSQESFNGNAPKPIFISAAPQCTAAADGHIGFMWPILTGGAKYFTDMWIQFYNNYCYYGGSGRYNPGEWQAAISSLNPAIKWYSGIPASPDAGGGFVGGSVSGLVRESVQYQNWDGIMMWDASWDQYNNWYSDTVRSALDSADQLSV